MVFNCLKRINTLYPSKYLSVLVAALETVIIKNAYLMQDPSSLIRRAYLLCRNYEPNEPPTTVKLDDGTNIPDDQLSQINDVEIKLQAKLLRRLITTAAGEGFRDTLDRSLFEFFYKMSKLPLAEAKFYEQILPLKNNVYDAALSLDIDLMEELTNSVERSRKIYKGIPSDTEITSREAQIVISKNILKLSLTYQLQNLKFKNSLDLNDNGIVTLCSWYYLFNHKFLPISKANNIKFDDLIYLYLNLVTPQLFAKSAVNNSGEGALQFFMWVFITRETCSSLRQILQEMSQTILYSFLSCLLLRICNAGKPKDILMMDSTLLTRILCLSPTDLICNFGLDNLKNLPYVNGKLLILKILKDLIMKENTTTIINKDDDKDKDIHDVIEKIDKLDLKNEDKKVTHYLELNMNQMLSLQEIVQDLIQSMEEITDDNEKFVNENLLIAFLNFFIDVKQFWSPPLLKQLKDFILNAKTNVHERKIIHSLLDKL